MKKNLGFTLIELLVIISIISLLSSITLSSLQDARAKARDARRLEDLRQINYAIQLYIQDNGEAPSGRYKSTDINGGTAWDGNFEDELRKYIKKLPLDPLNGEPFTASSKINFRIDRTPIGNESNSYKYYYHRLDDWYGECRNGASSCPIDSYILDVTAFEKRSNSAQTWSSIFGGHYPKISP